MAGITQILESNNNGNEISREEIKIAITKAVELRALHAVLLQGNSPVSLKMSSPSSFPHHASHLSAQDYPVFTPSYEDESLSGYEQTPVENQIFRESWDDYSKANTSCRRNNMGHFRSLSSLNQYKNSNYSNLVVPLGELHSTHQTHPSKRGFNFSRLFSVLKKKSKNQNPTVQSESQDLGAFSVEKLKKEVMEAIKSRDLALVEVNEMKSSLGELKQKLEHIEGYCEELKKNLKQATQGKNFQFPGIPFDGNEEMVEGFFQIASETRLSVKQFCKVLIGVIEVDNLNSLLQPYKLSQNLKHSRAVLFHLEAIINMSLYEDFENCVFRRSGAPEILDPREDRDACFSSFVALRNLTWNEVLSKGTKYYSAEFSRFCDEKMGCIIKILNWTRPWPEQLLQAFFVATKCVWLLHLLAFSFNPHFGIFRVEENKKFDSKYMEDVFMDRERSQGGSKVKIMIMPGFYVKERVLRCKVICRYKSVT